MWAQDSQVNARRFSLLKHARVTVPYVHGQNGMIERRWCSRAEPARFCLSYSEIPLGFWPYVYHAAAYTTNRLPSARTPRGSTAFEAHYRRQPSVGPRDGGSGAGVSAKKEQGSCPRQQQQQQQYTPLSYQDLCLLLRGQRRRSDELLWPS